MARNQCRAIELQREETFRELRGPHKLVSRKARGEIYISTANPESFIYIGPPLNYEWSSEEEITMRYVKGAQDGIA